MTTLHDLANAISDGSPNIKAFAVAVADKLEPVAPPPPPPPPPPSGAVAFSNDYAATALPYGWNNGGFQVIPSPGAIVEVVKDGYAPGHNSLRITMPAGGASLHAEGLQERPVKIGEERFVAWSSKFHSPWNPTGGWGFATAQPSYQAFVNSTIAAMAWRDHERLVLLTGKQSWTQTPNQAGIGLVREYNNTDGYAQGPSPRIIGGNSGVPFVTDQWIRRVMRIVNAYDAKGVCEVWVSVAGGPFTKTVSLVNVQTLQWGVSNTNHPLSNTAQGYPINDKLGGYTGPRAGTLVYEHAAVRIGSSFGAVA